MTFFNSYITKNGLICLTATSGFGVSPGTELVPITSITGTPTFLLNGSSIPIVVNGPFWTNTTKTCPWVMYQPSGSFLPTDSLVFETNLGWALSAAGPAQAQLGSVANYLNQLEPSVGTMGGITVPGLNQPSSTWTMQVGYNMSWGGKSYYYAQYNTMANSLKRGSDPAVKALAYGLNNHPTLLSVPFNLNPISTNQDSIDGRGTPTITGIYTFAADETNPPHPMVVTATLQTIGANNSFISSIPPVGTGVGKTWSWEVTYNPTGVTNYTSIIHLSIAGTGVGGGGVWSLANERFFGPNNTDPGTSFTINKNLANWLTTPGGKTASHLRWIEVTEDLGLNSNMVDIDDQMNPEDFIWGNQHINTFQIHTIRHFDTGVSPYTYWSNNWLNSTTPGGGPSGAPYALPTDPGMLNISGPNNGWFIGEAIHDGTVLLKSGQLISLTPLANSGTAIPCSNGTGVAVVSLQSESPLIYVTSPSSFVFTLFGYLTSTAGQPSNINNIIGSNSVAVTGSRVVPDYGSVGYGVCANLNGQLPNTNHYVNFPNAASDALVTDIITQVLNNFPSGRKIICEYGNELWNDGFDGILTCNVLGNGGAISSGNTPNNVFAIYRAAQIHDICYNVANSMGGRGNEIFRTFGSQYSVPAVTTKIISTVNSWNILNTGNPIIMHAVHVAPYIIAPSDSTLNSGCASIYYNFPSSIAYNTPYPWTRGQWLDVFRHHIKYNNLDNGPKGHGRSQLAAMSQYIPVAGQPSGFIPELVSYEGSLQDPVGATISSPNYNPINYGLAHDLCYDPDMFDWEKTMYQMAQFAGFSWFTVYAICMIRELEAAGTYEWQHYVWDGQQPGIGSGNLFYQDTLQGHDFENQSTRGAAWQEWTNVTNGPFAQNTIQIVNGQALFIGDGNLNINTNVISKPKIYFSNDGDLSSQVVHQMMLQTNVSMIADTTLSVNGGIISRCSSNFIADSNLFVQDIAVRETTSSSASFAVDGSLSIDNYALSSTNFATNCNGDLVVEGYNLDTNVPVYIVNFILRSQRTKRQ